MAVAMVATRRLNFKLFKSEAGYRVRFGEDGGPPIEAPFQADLKEDGRLAGVMTQIDNEICSYDDLRDLGTELWTGLNAEPIGSAVAEARRRSDSFFHICFELPPELERVPWETVYDPDSAGLLAVEPDYCVLRTPDLECAPIPPSKSPARSSACLPWCPKGQVWGSSRSSII